MGATRLPNKVLKEIAGKPMLLWQIERIRRSRLVDAVVVATTLNPNDDAIAEFCIRNGIECFRGPEEDVLARVAGLLREYKADIHVECFGDSPLVDPHIIDEFCGYLLKHFDELDIVLNSLKTTYPPGQEVIVYKSKALLEADKMVKPTDPLREHVSIHIYKHPEKFRILNMEAPSYYNFPDIFMEVDTREDFLMMSELIQHFSDQGKEFFTLSQILDYLMDNEELTKLNQHIERRWKKFREDE